MGQVGTRDIVRPPFSVWLRYRVVGVRVPAEWLHYVEADLARAGWLRRVVAAQFILPAAFIVLVWTAIGVATGGLAMGDFAGVFILVCVWGVHILFADWLERTPVYLGHRRMLLQYHRGERGDFAAPSRKTIPWMVAGVVIAAVIVLVVRALN
jgi:hypothetical protein